MDNADKLVPEKDAPKPAQNGTATSEVKKVLYKEIGSFVPEYPAGKKPQRSTDKILIQITRMIQRFQVILAR